MVNDSSRRVRFALFNEPSIASSMSHGAGPPYNASSTESSRLFPSESNNGSEMANNLSISSDSSVTSSSLKSRRWYSQEELDSLHSEAIDTLQQQLTHHAESRDLGTSEKIVEAFTCNGTDSLRGLEMLCDADSGEVMYRRLVINGVKRSVLTEQGRQRRRGVHDETAIAQASFRFSQFSAQYAVKLGLEDEEFVLLDRLMQYELSRRDQKRQSGDQNRNIALDSQKQKCAFGSPNEGRVSPCFSFCKSDHPQSIGMEKGILWGCDSSKRGHNSHSLPANQRPTRKRLKQRHAAGAGVMKTETETNKLETQTETTNTKKQTTEGTTETQTAETGTRTKATTKTMEEIKTMEETRKRKASNV